MDDEFLDKIKNTILYWKNEYGSSNVIDDEDFTEQANEILNSEEEKNLWRINTIKNNRVLYFNAMGLNLGIDYDAYKDNEEALN